VGQDFPRNRDAERCKGEEPSFPEPVGLEKIGKEERGEASDPDPAVMAPREPDDGKEEGEYAKATDESEFDEQLSGQDLRCDRGRKDTGALCIFSISSEADAEEESGGVFNEDVNGIVGVKGAFGAAGAKDLAFIGEGDLMSLRNAPVSNIERAEGKGEVHGNHEAATFGKAPIV